MVWRNPFDALMLPAMRGWVRSARANTALIPRPTGIPRVHADGPSADRVLMIGAGALVGFGVLTYDLSLCGHLARSLSARTERGVDIDILARVGMTATTALERLRKMALWRYDAVILGVGLNESNDLMPPMEWRRELTALLDFVASKTSSTTQIGVLGVPPNHSMPALYGPLGSFADRHAHKFDVISKSVCDARPRTQFISLTDSLMPRQVDVPAGEDYRAAADVIGEFMAPALEEARLNPNRDLRLDDGFIDERRRQRSVDALRGDDSDAVERVVELARELFGTQAAIFSVIDGDRSRHPVHLGVDYPEVPRASSFCSVTIQHRGAMIIPDARTDDRFKNNPFVVGDPHIRFYAGFPIEAPDGEPIGALCVLDPEPRESSGVDEVLLRRLALQLQQQLLLAPAAESAPQPAS